MLKLDVKKQVPNLLSADAFFINTIKKAYKQLESSYLQLENKDSVLVIKVILLYDEFSNTAIIEQSMRDIFGKDLLCFIMTIREFEILLYLYANEKYKFDSIVENIKGCTTCKTREHNIGSILEKVEVYDNLHFTGSRDFLLAHLRRIESIIKTYSQQRNYCDEMIIQLSDIFFVTGRQRNASAVRWKLFL